MNAQFQYVLFTNSTSQNHVLWKHGSHFKNEGCIVGLAGTCCPLEVSHYKSLSAEETTGRRGNLADITPLQPYKLQHNSTCEKLTKK